MKEYYTSKLDSQFTKIKGINYLPWVGTKLSENQEKVLIIGESVYNWGVDSQEREIAANRLAKNDFVRNLVYEHGIEARYSYKDSIFFRNIEKMLINNADENRVDLWNNMVFHELVQRPLENSKDRPTSEDYQNGAEVLAAIIKITKPTKCLFLGTTWDKYKSLKDALDKEYQTEDFHFDKISNSKPKVLKVKELNTKIYFIKHPSSYFTAEKWKAFIENN